jgi:hypothetical protein
MRILDVAHAWASQTHSQYQTKLKFVRKFESAFPGLTILKTSTLSKPPNGAEIGIMWAEEAFSLRPAAKQVEGEVNRVTFGTIRALRSAVSQFMTVHMMMRFGGSLAIDQNQRLTVASVRPTDDATCTFFTKGLRSRLGDAPKPSHALLHRQVSNMDHFFQQEFARAPDQTSKRYWARAAVANLSLWLGWLRSCETFDLRWCDAFLIKPSQARAYDLSAGCGAVRYRLAPETKSLRSQEADVAIAYTSYTGLSLGTWLQRLRKLVHSGGQWSDDHRLIFCHEKGTAWTSLYYRKEFLYPALERMRKDGDVLLRAFDGSAGNSIPNKFWSLHCYRRGARTHVSRRHRTLGTRAASSAETYEHARWRRRRSAEPIDVLYRQWTLRERLCLTQYCM